MNTRTLLILDDGETFSLADGCRLVVVTEEVADALQDGVRWEDIQFDSTLSDGVISCTVFESR